MNLHLLGIRHHGVGSARNVLEQLEQLRPDLVLVEGPPELTDILHWIAHRNLVPPVAILAYDADDPKRASFYPFAEYSPEWVAVKWAFEQNIPVRTLDLPLTHSLGSKVKGEGLEEGEGEGLKVEGEDGKEAETPKEGNEHEEGKNEEENLNKKNESNPKKPPSGQSADADGGLLLLAQAAGYDDYHAWWENQFEQNFRKNESAAHFEAVLLTMTAARENQPNPAENELREAFMRHELRQAEKDGVQQVAVVCGAWHAPALRDWQTPKKTDEALMKGLPKVRVRCTWIPWTNSRMGWWSGYGAGIQSPGWYEHRWHRPHDAGIEWLTGVARLFRDNKMDISTAHVIEAFRLAEALAAMRGLQRAGLGELNEATQSVMCMGDAVLLKLVEEQLIISQRMGSVPDELPKLPIQVDFESITKKLRLELRENAKEIELDLRKENDLAKSVLLHRLLILEVNWGKKMHLAGKGTFKEGWTLKWESELWLKLIEKAIWGNRVQDAAEGFVLNNVQQAKQLAELSKLLETVIPAELFGVLPSLLTKINDLATVAADIQELMAAVLPLVRVSRYGNVRKTDLSAIGQVVESLITRVCVGLPTACYGLDNDNAQRVFALIRQVDEAVRLLENASLSTAWRQTLLQIADKDKLPPLLLGGTVRLLFDNQIFDEPETTRRFGLALSSGQEPAYSAAWVEGFLKGSGLILLYDQSLWLLIYRWVETLESAAFTELLPILRRTFSGFDPAERKQLGEKAQRQQTQTATIGLTENETIHFNPQRAERSLAVIQTLLGI